MKKFAERGQLDLSKVNKEVLEDWLKEDLFRRSIKEREGCPSFVFYEGPPSANGMPGIHHVMARTIKDTFCRYKTMCGYQVNRKAGWDTHGLPVELGVEKKLGTHRIHLRHQIGRQKGKDHSVRNPSGIQEHGHRETIAGCVQDEGHGGRLCFRSPRGPHDQ